MSTICVLIGTPLHLRNQKLKNMKKNFKLSLIGIALLSNVALAQTTPVKKTGPKPAPAAPKTAATCVISSKINQIKTNISRLRVINNNWRHGRHRSLAGLNIICWRCGVSKSVE